MQAEMQRNQMAPPPYYQQAVLQVSQNPFEYPPNQPQYLWFYKDPKGVSQGPFNAI